MNDTKRPPTPFDIFYAVGGQTPANAVRLAASDHRGQKIVDWEFVAALDKVETICDAHDELVAALQSILSGVLDEPYAAEIARAALAKVQP